MNNLLFEPSMKFNDPEKILFAAGLSAGQVFADFGAGSGFYSLAAGKIVGEQGVVYPLDILQTALDHIAAEGRLKGLRNLRTMRADLEQASPSAVPLGSVDMVLFSNITHQIKNKSALFKEAYRVLRTGGKLLIIDWNESPSPIGPPAAARMSQNEVEKQAGASNFKSAGSVPVDNYHYGLMFIK
jgi:ubiquinone/menaquinone biosynthesis C-methylase UbiE